MVKEGDDLVAMFLEALDASGLSLEYRDLVIVTSKVVSKSEGQVVDFDGTEEHKASLIEGESARILRRRGPLRITETYHGFINANAGIDLSNTDDGTAVLLPKDPDRSARRFRAEIQRRCSVEVAVIITDTFGRVWRVGVTDVAIGSAGVNRYWIFAARTTPPAGSSKSPSRDRRRDRQRGQSGARQGRSDTVRDPSRSRRRVLR